MKRSIPVALVTLLILLSVGRDIHLHWQNPQERVARLLSEQFETVLYSKPQFVSAWDTYNPLPTESAVSLRYPFSYLWSALNALPTPAANALLANSDGVMMGAKDFRAPYGLGGVRSQRVYAVLLKNGSSFKLQDYTNAEPMNAPSGLKIWQWSAILGEFGDGWRYHSDVWFRPSNLYATIVKSSYLLVSNSEVDLENLANRFASANGISTSAASDPDWHAMLQHDMWGYRKYRALQLNPMAEGTEDVPTEAESLSFFVDTEKKSLTLQMSSNDPISEKDLAKFVSRHQLPYLKQTGKHAWESTITLSNDQTTFDQSFIVMGMFGFAVYS